MGIMMIDYVVATRDRVAHAWGYLAGGVILVLAAVALLLRVAGITQMCTGTTMGRESVPAAIITLGGKVDRMSSQQQREYLILVQQISLVPLGITVCSLQINYRFVLTVSYLMVIHA